jgi:hypothetical protein
MARQPTWRPYLSSVMYLRERSEHEGKLGVRNDRIAALLRLHEPTDDRLQLLRSRFLMIQLASRSSSLRIPTRLQTQLASRPRSLRVPARFAFPPALRSRLTSRFRFHAL